ncbi:MAG TPA: hypothetical protein VHM16_05520 [Rubrobacteraceae bacterium]|nr:hypothetical protein [Rubrobacteraceae bacterium]
MFGARSKMLAILLVALLVSLVMGLKPTSAAVSSQGFTVSANEANETSPAVSGNIAVWTVARAGGADIQGKNLSTGADLGLPEEVGNQTRPSVSGRTVVWQDNSSGNPDIYGYNLNTGQKFPVATGPGNQTWPAISGRTVVWEDDRNGNRDVYGYNLDTNQERLIAGGALDQRRPDIGGDTVVWEEHSAFDSDIVAENLTSGEEQRLVSDPSWQSVPSVGGDTVAWLDERNPGSSDIYGYDLGSQRELQISVEPGDQYAPSASDRVVVWEDDRNGNRDVYGKDVSTGEKFPVASGQMSQENPSVSGNVVVWETQRVQDQGFGTYDAYGAELDLAPAAPAGLAARGTADGVELDWTPSGEQDLAGYNVYRSGSENGEFTKLNTGGLLSASAYKDASAPRGARSYYRVTAVDAADSESAVSAASAVVPERSEITLEASATVLNIGGTATLSGTLTSNGLPLSGRTVILEHRPMGTDTFVPVPNGELSTGALGNFSLAGLRPEKNTEYQARFTSGAEEIQSSESLIKRVDVKQMVSISSSTSVVRLGRGLSISGSVFPAKTGMVKMTIKRNGVVAAQRSASLNSGRYTLRYRPPAPGVYEAQATLADYPVSLISSRATSFRVVR